MALLALPLAVLGRVVSSTEAASVARAWAREGVHMGVNLSANVEAVAQQITTNDAPFFAVKLVGGGTVFTAGDTEVAPIVAFTASSEDFSVLDRKSPLWALLNRDLSSRTRVRVQAGAQNAPAKQAQLLSLSSSAALSAAAELQASSNANERAWGNLLAADANAGKRLMAAPKESIGDVCVPMLVQSMWSQSTHDDSRSGQATYNYCTPQTNVPRADGTYTVTNDAVNNAVCGCVATAMSQLMRYHKYPTIPVTNNLTRSCWFDTTQISLTMQGGVYDWDGMTLHPKTDGSLTESNRCAIGKITSDAGIAVKMRYTLNDSGSYISDACQALRDTFHFGQAYYYNATWDGSKHPAGMCDANMLNNAVFANFDAGLPVLFGITGTGGHAIVGDGYGFDGGNAYVHLNLGWSGSSDMWYNLPNIGTGHMFSAVDEIVYNCLTTNKTAAIFSGRVLDVNGALAAGAAVKVYANNSPTLVAEGVVNARGTFAFTLPPAVYDVQISFAGGMQSAALEDVAVNRPNASSRSDITYTDPTGKQGMMTVNNLIASSANSGNVRVDVQLEWADTVRINNPETGAFFASLDDALAAAASDNVLYVCHPTVLNGSAVVDKNVKIVSTNLYNKVTRARDAQLKVASGVTLQLEKQHFVSADEEDASAMIVVASNGVVQVGSDVRVPQGYHTAMTNGFAMAAALTEAVYLTCDAGMNVGDRVGVVLPGVADAALASVNRVLHPTDDELGGEVEEVGGNRHIVWSDMANVDQKDAAVNVNGKNRRSLDSALRHLSTAADTTISLYTNCTMSVPDVTVTRNLKIGSFTSKTWNVLVAPEAGFVVNAGGALEFERTLFDGGARNRDSFVRVNGGTLTLGLYGKLRSFNGTNGVSGAICARNGGTVKMTGTGAEIRGCENLQGKKTSAQVLGGGMTLYGSTAELSAGSITRCFAPTHGGGVFADETSKIHLSGSAVVSDNLCGDKYGVNHEYNDLGVLYTNAVVVKGAFTGTVGVSVYNDLNQAGETFAVADGSLSDADAAAAAGRFFNSHAKYAGETLQAQYDVGTRTYSWCAPKAASQQCTPAAAGVKVVYGGNDAAAEYYARLETALSCLTNAATITLLQTCALAADAEVTYPVLLTAADPSYCLTRGSAGIARNTEFELFTIEICPGASLTLSNLLVDCSRDENLCAVGSAQTGWQYYYKTCPILFYVNYGELTLAEGAKIRNMWGNEETLASCAVGVAGGTLTMLSGSEISACSNTVKMLVQQAGGGAVRVGDAGMFNFFGGTITRCLGQDVGGIAINNESTLRVRGDAKVTLNYLLDGVTEANLTVSDDSTFELSAPLAAATSTIGVMAPVDSCASGDETNRVATIGADLNLMDGDVRTNVAYSAACFRRDTDGARGVLATNLAGVAYVVFTNGVENLGEFPYVPFAFATAIYAGGPSSLILEGLPSLSIQSFTYNGVTKEVSITATNAMKHCYYTLWYNNKPDGDFTYVPNSQKHDAVGPVTFNTTKPDLDGAIFWKVIIDDKPYDAK